MALLPDAQIRRLHAAIVASRLTSSRAALLGNIAPAFVDSLPTTTDPSSQILSDLHQLNSVDRLSDGTVPLHLWLENVIALVGRRGQSAIFIATLQILTGNTVQQERGLVRVWRHDPWLGLVLAVAAVMCVYVVARPPSVPPVKEVEGADTEQDQSVRGPESAQSQVAPVAASIRLPTQGSIECELLKIDDVIVQKAANHLALDVRVRNPGTQVINVTRAHLRDACFVPRSDSSTINFVDASAVYDSLGRDVPVAHVLQPGGVDRFVLKFRKTDVNCMGMLLLDYNCGCEATTYLMP